MKRWSHRALFSLAWLAALSLTGLSQSKTPKRPARHSGQPVTVTLVRWPYT